MNRIQIVKFVLDCHMYMYYMTETLWSYGGRIWRKRTEYCKIIAATWCFIYFIVFARESACVLLFIFISHRYVTGKGFAISTRHGIDLSSKSSISSDLCFCVPLWYIFYLRWTLSMFWSCSKYVPTSEVYFDQRLIILRMLCCGNWWYLCKLRKYLFGDNIPENEK